MRVTTACLIAFGYATTCAADTLTIHVRDRLTAAPVPDAVIVMTGRRPVVETVLTDAKGIAHIETSDRAGLALAVRSVRHGVRCVSADAADPDGVIAIDLEPTVRVRGRVSDARGKSIAGATVLVAYERDPACRFHLTPQPSRVQADGAYAVGHVDPSRPFSLVFEAPGFQRAVLRAKDLQTATTSLTADKRGQVSEQRELNVTLNPESRKEAAREQD
jgi:hypothetical protein